MICNDSCFELNDILFSLTYVLCLHLWLYSDTHFLDLWCLDAMIWEYATNMFVKHDVEQVQGQEKHQYTSFGLTWSKPKKGRLLNQRLKTWRLVLGFCF